MSTSAKQAALAVIENLPRDATMDEIIDALWAWAMTEPGGSGACAGAGNRILTVNPAVLVMAGRAARHTAILGIGRQSALNIVEALPDQITLEDILVAVTTWHGTEETD